MKDVVVLVVAVVSFVMSFALPEYYVQFLVLGAVLLSYYFSSRTSGEMEELRAIIRKHNELLQKDIELMEEEENWN